VRNVAKMLRQCSHPVPLRANVTCMVPASSHMTERETCCVRVGLGKTIRHPYLPVDARLGCITTESLRIFRRIRHGVQNMVLCHTERSNIMGS